MIRRARPEEARRLSELAYRSKAHWGYSAEFMAACRDELTLTRATVEDYVVLVAELDGDLVGFASLEPLGSDEVELGHLFVEPARIGEGHGRRLFEAACAGARESGYVAMIVQGDPNAAGFYRRMGAQPIGTRPSDSIPGRELPLYRVSLR